MLRPHPQHQAFDVPPITPVQRVEVGVQGYEYPNGNLGRHTDKDDSLVYLISLGCTAQFLIKTPEMDDDTVIFDFNNGDVLYFDASPSANIEHGILSILSPSTSPQYLPPTQTLDLQSESFRQILQLSPLVLYSSQSRSRLA